MSKKHKKLKRWLREHDWDWPTIRAKLYIEPHAYEKLSYYVQLASGEISGFGKIEINKTVESKWLTNEKILLKDVEIFEQRCSCGGTTLDGDAMAKFIVSLIRRKQNPNDWRLWWHSHNDFSVSWSGIDEMAIDGLTEQGGAELISICMNKDSDVIARRDKSGKWKYEQLDVRILPRIDINRYNKCERAFKKKVTEHKFKLADHDYENWDWKKSRDKKIPLLEYNPSKVKIITDRQSLILGLRYNPDTGLFTRISDNKILNGEELRDELRETAGHPKPVLDIKVCR